MRGFFIHSPKDNVAVATRDLKAGTVMVVPLNEKPVKVKLLDDIPLGHKFALRRIEAGAAVVKYGEAIGVATKTASAGAHVHVHNLKSQRF